MLVEPDVRGDPMSPVRWTTKSTRKLAEQLTRQGHRISADTVGDLLREEGFSLQSNAKTLEGKQHPDGDAQFWDLATGRPVRKLLTNSGHTVFAVACTDLDGAAVAVAGSWEGTVHR